MIKSNYLSEKTGVFQHLYILENFMINFDSIIFCMYRIQQDSLKTNTSPRKRRRKRRRKRPNCSEIRFVYILFFYFFLLFFSIDYYFLYTYLDLGFLSTDRIRERRDDGAGKP
jgi:hypothetical protein